MSDRNAIVVAAVEAPGGLREIDGVKRISGTELGRRLEYCVSDPTKFNKRVVEKLLKGGKINDSDIATEKSQCRKGFRGSLITEYWLTLPLARSIALNHVRTPRANELRAQVVEQLDRLMEETQEALQALTPDYAGLAAAVQENTRVVAEHSVWLRTLAEAKEPASIYIDEERNHLLKRLAQDTIAARGEGSVQALWAAVQRKHNLTKARKGKHPRVFETVTVDKFAAVLADLRADLGKALSTPSKVTSLLRRASVAAGNSVDVRYVCERVNRLLENVEVPLYAMPRLYALANLMVYPRPNGKNPDLRIDEAEIRKLVSWCTDHPHELNVFLESEKQLHQLKAASGRRRGAAVAE